MSTHGIRPSLAELQHDALANGKSAELLVECLKISGATGRLLETAKAASADAWDAIANLDTALHAS